MNREEPRQLLREAFLGLSRAAQAVLGYLALAGLHSDKGHVLAAEVKTALGLTDEQWARAAAELYEAAKGWECTTDGSVDSPFDAFEAQLTHDLAQFATGASGRPTAKEWERIRSEVFAYHFEHVPPHCLICREETNDLALDHIQPVARGGSNHFLNIMPLCKSCNSSKGAKPISEWFPASAAGRRLR